MLSPPRQERQCTTSIAKVNLSKYLQSIRYPEGKHRSMAERLQCACPVSTAIRSRVHIVKVVSHDRGFRKMIAHPLTATCRAAVSLISAVMARDNVDQSAKGEAVNKPSDRSFAIAAGDADKSLSFLHGVNSSVKSVSGTERRRPP
jgi:hypothetical protein